MYHHFHTVHCLPFFFVTHIVCDSCDALTNVFLALFFLILLLLFFCLRCSICTYSFFFARVLRHPHLILHIWMSKSIKLQFLFVTFLFTLNEDVFFACCPHFLQVNLSWKRGKKMNERSNRKRHTTDVNMCESEVKMQTKEKLTSSELVGKTGKWQKWKRIWQSCTHSTMCVQKYFTMSAFERGFYSGTVACDNSNNCKK